MLVCVRENEDILWFVFYAKSSRVSLTLITILDRGCSWLLFPCCNPLPHRNSLIFGSEVSVWCSMEGLGEQNHSHPYRKGPRDRLSSDFLPSKLNLPFTTYQQSPYLLIKGLTHELDKSSSYPVLSANTLTDMPRGVSL